MLRSLINAARLPVSNLIMREPQFLHSRNILKQSSYSKSSLEAEDAEEQEVMPSDAEQLGLTREIIQKVNNQIGTNTHGRLFAVVYVAGRQYLISPEDLMVVYRVFPPTYGDRIRFEKVLAVGGRDFTLFGRPLLPKDLVNVEATVVEKTLDSTKAQIKYKAVKKSIRFQRLPMTVLRINKIEVDHKVDCLPSVEGVEGRVF